MSGTSIVTEIVGILVAGIQQLGAGIGAGISNFVQSLAFTTTGEGSSATTNMSVFLVMVCVFAAIALAVGLTRLIFNWLQNLGGH